MEKDYLLVLNDYSSKECEVTGEELGGDYYYEILLSMLKPGLVEWPNSSRRPEHAIEVKKVGKDYVSIVVYDVARSQHSVTLHPGESYSDGYCFGEWSYFCRVSLVEVDSDAVKSHSHR